MTAHTALLAALVATAALCALGGAQAEYSPDIAMSAIWYSKTSNCDQNEIQDWVCPACKFNPEPCEVRHESDWMSGAFGYVTMVGDRIVVAFRGSQNVQNWIHNIVFALERYPSCSMCQVHAGFRATYQTIKDNILRSVQEFLDHYEVNSILITGHSLGGAVATLAAADISMMKDPSGHTPHIDLYTFGSPRVGNQAFANWMVRLFCEGGHSSYRVTHKKDLVTLLPPVIGFSVYTHIGQEIYFEDNSPTDWTECDDIKGNTCDKKKSVPSKKCSGKHIWGEGGDHDMYLGELLDCVYPHYRLSSPQKLQLSPRLKLLLAADAIYARSAENFLNFTY